MRRYLHFITKPYSLSVIQALVEEIERGHWGDSLIILPPLLEKYIRNDMRYTTSIEEAGSFDPDVVFVPGNVVHDKIPGLKVQVFHGICEEKGGHYKITSFFDLYCTSGPLITRNFKKLAEKYGYFHVVETGWPKVDLLMNPYNRAEILMKLGVRPENSIILYAPTFSPIAILQRGIIPALKSRKGSPLGKIFKKKYPPVIPDKASRRKNNAPKLSKVADIFRLNFCNVIFFP